MSDLVLPGRATVLVCISCRAAPGSTESDEPSRAGSVLAAAAIDAAAAVDPTAPATAVTVQRVRCLGNCNRGLSAAIRCENAWSYVFGGLDAQRDGPVLIEGARLLAAARDGILPWRGRPESLKRGLVARLPPTVFVEETS